MGTAVVIIAIVAVLGLAVFMIINGNKPKSEQAKTQKEIYRKGYKFLSRNFITQGSIRKIYSKLSNLCVYKREELYVLTLQYWAMSWGVSAVLIIFAAIVFSDAISILMCIAFALLLNTTIIDKQLDKQYFSVLYSTSKALGAIREEYMKSNSVVEAINDAPIDDILKKPFDDIYSILTSTDADLKLQEFYAATPFRTLQTLVGICYNINNQGDTRD